MPSLRSRGAPSRHVLISICFFKIASVNIFIVLSLPINGSNLTLKS